MSEGSPFEPRPSFPAGARCATHPERAAERTCLRCGNYMCAECISASGSGMCLSCASRTGTGGTFPFSRDNYTFDGLLNFALSRWKQHWLPLALAFAVTGIALYVPVFLATLVIVPLQTRGDSSMVSVVALQIGSQLLAAVLQTAGQLALFGYALDLLENKPTSLTRALERVRKLPAMLLIMLIIYGAILVAGGAGAGVFFLVDQVVSRQAAFIAAGVFALLCLPLFIYVSISLSFTTLALAHDPDATAISALRVSWQLVEGRRWSVAGVLFVSGLISGLGVIACCIGLLASAPLGTLLYASLFLALKQVGRPNELPVTQEWPV